MDQDRTFAKEETWGLNTRLKDEFQAIDKNFEFIKAKLDLLEKKQNEMIKEQAAQKKKIDKISAKVNRSSGFFANLCRSIPFVGSAFSAIDAVKDGYDAVSPEWEESKGGTFFGKVGNSFKAIGKNIWGTLTSFFG